MVITPQLEGSTTVLHDIARALRKFPVVVQLTQRIEVLCPGAWLLNYANPMTTHSMPCSVP